jgi:hypothetical protein
VLGWWYWFWWWWVGSWLKWMKLRWLDDWMIGVDVLWIVLNAGRLLRTYTILSYLDRLKILRNLSLLT